MNHPIYNYITMMKLVDKLDEINNDPKLIQLEVQDAYMRAFNDGKQIDSSVFQLGFERAKVFQAIRDKGHILIDAKDYDWESKISQSTIGKMSVGDFKFPFVAGTISMKNYSVFYYHNKNTLSIFWDYNDGKKNNLELDGYMLIDMQDGIKIGDEIEDSPEKDILYSILSVLLYLSIFQKVRERVSKPKVIISKNKKKKKKSKIETHKINVIKLIQNNASPSYNNGSLKVNTTTPKTEKMWTVRGHWRNQWYESEKKNKPKWIDQYWKGSGMMEVEKSYKI